MPAPSYPTLNAACAALAAAGVTHVVFQRGDASGDQSHVLPLLAMHAYNAMLPPGAAAAPTYGVLVIDALLPRVFHGVGPAVNGIPSAPKGRRMADSYVDDFHVPPALVAYVDVAQAAMMMGTALAALPGHGLQKLNLTTATTRTTALVLSGQLHRRAIKAQFRGPNVAGPLPAGLLPAHAPQVVQDFALNQFRVAEHIPDDRHVVVLWGRKSGKRGGLHPEMDSSTTGMAQIAAACHARGWCALLAGDIAQAKVAGPAAHAGFANAIWLGEFWNRWAPIPNRRDLQIRFFYVLAQQLKAAGRRLVHVGMRSGGLDMYTFSGQRVVYIVAPTVAGGNLNDNRMQPVATAITAARAAAVKASGSYSFTQFVAARVPRAHGIHVGPGGPLRPRGFSTNPTPGPPFVIPAGYVPGDLERLMGLIANAL